MIIPFDRDLTKFSDEDLRETLRWLRRGWCMPRHWWTIAKAYIAIRYELEWRKELERNRDPR